MKLKKILAGALVAAMVLTGIPTSGIQVFAWDNDILTSSYTGYQNIDLYAEEPNKNVEVTAASKNDSYPSKRLVNNDFSQDWWTAWGGSNCYADNNNYVEFTLTTPQTVAGVLYLVTTGQNAAISRAKIEVATEGGEYKTVYQTPYSESWLDTDHSFTVSGSLCYKGEAIFTPVSNVKKVKVWGWGTDSTKLTGRKMRLVTIPDNIDRFTATAVSETPNLGTASVDIAHGSGHDSITVASGTPVVYTAAPNDSMIFLGWADEKGTIVSSEKTYQTTVKSNMTLTAKFRERQVQLSVIDVSEGTPYANSEQTSTDEVDNHPASKAFDNNSGTFWLVDWQNFGNLSKNNAAYIQMKFAKSKKVQQIEYLPRTDHSWGDAKDYEVLVAKKETGDPTDSEFVTVAKGTFSQWTTLDTDHAQIIELPYPVQATHVRLKITSTYGQQFPSASIIKYYGNQESSAKQIKNVSDLVRSANETMGEVTYSRTKTVEDYVEATQLTANPIGGSKFVKWVVTDESGKVTGTIKEQNPTVQMDGKHVYTAQFVKATVTGSDSFTLKTWSESADTSYTSGKKQLDITVDKTDGLNIDDIEWVSDNDNIAIVKAVENTDLRKASATVTAVAANPDGVSTTTIKATLAGKTLAQWTVTVDDATELQSKITDITSDVGEDISENTLKFKYRSDGEHASDLTDFINAYNAAKTDTTESVETLLTNLTNVYDNLQPLYKVTVDISDIDGLDPADVKLESKYTSDNLETNNWLTGSDQTSKWIYVPMIEKVTVSVPEAVNTTDGGSIKFTQWNDITTGIPVKAASVREYSFYIVDKYTYKPQYDTSEPASDIINYCKTKYTKSTKKLSFVAKRNVPRNEYIIREHGVVITDRIGWFKYYKKNEDAFKKGATRTRKSTAKGKAHSGTYEAIMTAKQVGESTEWYGRSYIEYVKVKDGKIETDENGNEILYTNYSKVVPYPATSSVTN